jgi:hypothetical protein
VRHLAGELRTATRALPAARLAPRHVTAFSSAPLQLPYGLPRMLATVGRRSKTFGAYDAMRQAVVSCLHQVLGGGVDLVELVIVSRDAGGGEPGSVVVGQGVEIDGGGDPVGDGDTAGDLAVGVRCGQG